MWMLPLAYGGPSCKTKVGLPSFNFGAFRKPYFLPIRFDVSNSRTGKLPRIGNFGFPKFKVSFDSHTLYPLCSGGKTQLSFLLIKQKDLAHKGTRSRGTTQFKNLNKFHSLII